MAHFIFGTGNLVIIFKKYKLYHNLVLSQQKMVYFAQHLIKVSSGNPYN